MRLRAVFCAALAVGCTNGDDTPDASTDARAEISIPDVAHERNVGSCSLDGGAFPQGTQIVASNAVNLFTYKTVTTDGHILYQDRRTDLLYVVPLAGGVPKQLGPDWSTWPTISGNVISDYLGVDFNLSPEMGQLVVWSASSPTDSGKVRLVSPASWPGVFAVSGDGAWMAYSDNAMAAFPPEASVGTGTTDIWVSSIDGSMRTKIASSVPWDPNCKPNLVFAGTTLLMASCSYAPATQPAAIIHAYQAPSFTPTTLSTQPTYGNYGIGVSPDASTIYYFTAGPRVVVQGLSGSPITMPIYCSTPAWVMFTHDSKSVIQMDSCGYVLRSPVSSTVESLVSPTTFNTNAGLEGLSSDDKWLIVSRNQSNCPGPTCLYDADLLSTTPTSNPIAAEPTANAAFLGDYFTADNAHVILGVNNAPVPYYPNYFEGDFVTVPLSSPNTAFTTVAPKTVWTGYAATGSKVVYNDNFDIVDPSLPIADIKLVDLSNPSSHTLLVSAADYSFYVTPDKKNIVYTWSYCADDYAGLYVLPVP